MRQPCGLRVSRTQILVTIGQRALAADDRADEVEAGRIFRRAAEAHDLALGGDDFEAEDVVHGDAVFERVRAAGVGADVAADRARALARRIGGVVVAGAGEMAIERGVDDAGLDDGVAIAEIDFEDRLHPREHDDHAAADRRAAAGEARARPARHERHARGHAELDDAGDLLRRLAERRRPAAECFSSTKASHS